MLKLNKIKPMHTKFLCTANKYEEIQYIPGTNMIDPNKKETSLREYQTVLAIGNEVTTLKVGDVVYINPSDYMVKRYDKNSLKSDMNDVYNPVISYNFPIILIKEQECLLLKERDVDFVIEESEEVEDLPELEGIENNDLSMAN